MTSHVKAGKKITDSIGNRMFLCYNFPLDIGVVENVGLSLMTFLIMSLLFSFLLYNSLYILLVFIL